MAAVVAVVDDHTYSNYVQESGRMKFFSPKIVVLRHENGSQTYKFCMPGELKWDDGTELFVEKESAAAMRFNYFGAAAPTATASEAVASMCSSDSGIESPSEECGRKRARWSNTNFHPPKYPRLVVWNDVFDGLINVIFSVDSLTVFADMLRAGGKAFKKTVFGNCDAWHTRFARGFLNRMEWLPEMSDVARGCLQTLMYAGASTMLQWPAPITTRFEFEKWGYESPLLCAYVLAVVFAHCNANHFQWKNVWLRMNLTLCDDTKYTDGLVATFFTLHDIVRFEKASSAGDIVDLVSPLFRCDPAFCAAKLCDLLFIRPSPSYGKLIDMYEYATSVLFDLLCNGCGTDAAGGRLFFETVCRRLSVIPAATSDSECNDFAKEHAHMADLIETLTMSKKRKMGGIGPLYQQYLSEMRRCVNGYDVARNFLPISVLA